MTVLTRDSGLIQETGDLSETDLSNETQHPRTRANTTEEKVRNRLFELAMKMSEKETSSGEDQESEPKTESENHKESLSSEDNSQSIEEELKKVRAPRQLRAAARGRERFCGHRNLCGSHRSRGNSPPVRSRRPRAPSLTSSRDPSRKPALCVLRKASRTSHLSPTPHQRKPSASGL